MHGEILGSDYLILSHTSMISNFLIRPAMTLVLCWILLGVLPLLFELDIEALALPFASAIYRRRSAVFVEDSDRESEERDSRGNHPIS